MIKNIDNSEQYSWGDQCIGWHLVQSESLSVIEELMPPNTSEQRHYHKEAVQFFYILNGTATFEVGGEVFIVEKRKGIQILPGLRHFISNTGDVNLEFLVISQPTTHGDRVNE